MGSGSVYKVYSDASVRINENKASGAFIIIKNEVQFISSRGYKAFGTNSSYIAELLAVTMAVKYIYENNIVNKEDKLVLCTDNSKVFFLISEYIDNSKKDNCKYCLERTLFKLLDQLECSISKMLIKSHSQVNPNGLVDRLSRYNLD